jgi:hypothetical protein
MADIPFLLHLLRDDPQDDGARLALKTYLNKHDPPRGELIEVQMELDRPYQGHARYAQLGTRKKELLVANRDRWAGPLARYARFNKGMIHLDLNIETFLNPTFQALAGHEVWNWVESIEFFVKEDSLLAVVGDSPLLAGVPVLTFHGSNFAVEPATRALRCLASSPYLGALRELTIRYIWVSPAGLDALLASKSISHLRGLSLRSDHLGPKAARSLARWPGLANLTKLRLRCCCCPFLPGGGIGDEGLAELAASPYLSGLRHLAVAGSGIGDRGVAALAHSPHVRGLTLLDLRSNCFGPLGTRALAGSPHLAGLRELLIGHMHNCIGPEGAKALAASPYLTGLTVLDASWAGVGDEGAAAIAGSPNAASLRELSLYMSDLGDAGAMAISESAHLAGLAVLQLGTNKIGNKGAKAVAASPHLANLQHLEMSCNKIRGAGGRSLAASTTLASDLRLYMGQNPLGQKVKSALEARYGACVTFSS